MKVELIYDADCPNVPATRSLLIKAFTQTGVSARWKEWDRNSAESPAYASSFGSPSILVDGQDIAGVLPSTGTRACRVYSGSGGTLQTTPPLELICTALLKGEPAKQQRAGGAERWQSIVASFPAVGTALLPKLTCPLCWPAYAALLSALGLEFFDYTPYLLPLTLAFLAVALGALTIEARRTGHWAAFVAGIAASAIVVLGKFWFEQDWLVTAGVSLLVVAIFISMRRRAPRAVSCPACPGRGNDAKATSL